MYSSVPYSQQVPVYFRKFVRINSRDSAWKYILFSAIIGGIIGAVCHDKNFNPNGVFITVSGCIWLGIFNTIQSVCKEHDIINSEYRQGMNLGSFLTAHVLWQAVLCFIQALLMFIVLLIFGMFSGIEFGDAMMIFLMFYLMVFGSAILGLMISCLVPTPTTAMTIMPFVLIIQLLLGDHPIDLDGVGEGLTYITFSRWGMRAVGEFASTVKPDYEHAKPTVDAMGKPSLDIKNIPLFESGFGNTGGAFLMCLLLITIFIAISYAALVARNKKAG